MFQGRPVPVLCLDVDRKRLPVLYPLLQQGFILENDGNYTVKMFLSEALRLSREYIEERIQTVFLDGKVVDDLDSAVPGDRAVLALSAAMPGLAGAVLRRNTPYGPFRSSITARRGEAGNASPGGILIVKLFNLIARDLGPALFERGLVFEASGIQSFFGSPAVESGNCFERIRMDGAPVKPDSVRKWRCEPDDFVLLRVVSPG